MNKNILNLTGEDRLKQLESEMEEHKARFLAASRRGIDSFRQDLSLASWVGTYPLQATALAFAGGLFLGFALDRSSAPSVR